MSDYPEELKPAELQAIFDAVSSALAGHQAELNQMDEVNHDHGDHMVEIFQAAAQAAEEKQAAPMADAMEHAAGLLRQLPQNGSAQVYGRGLNLVAAQFRQRQIELSDLLPVVRKYLREEKESGEEDSAKGDDAAKALLAALAEWEAAEARQVDGSEGKERGLDVGYLFGVGMAYLQAKQKGGDRLDVISETVVSASPLGKVPYRHASGVIAVRALLGAMSG